MASNKTTVRLEGLRGVLDALKQLPPEVVSKAGGPVKLALKAAAKVLLTQAKANVRRIIDQQNLDGADSKSTGLLESSIVSARGKMPAGLKGERQSVRIRPGPKYPTTRGKDLSAVQIGRQLEFGTEKRQPYPWLRPAFDEKKGAATMEFVTQMNKRVDAIIKKLERQARSKI